MHSRIDWQVIPCIRGLSLSSSSGIVQRAVVHTSGVLQSNQLRNTIARYNRARAKHNIETPRSIGLSQIHQRRSPSMPQPRATTNAPPTAHKPESDIAAKENRYDSKAAHHHAEYLEHVSVVQEKKAEGRMERHSATGHTYKESPKKGGAGGKGTWGTYKDDINAALNH